MAKKRVLARLLRLRELEEEMSLQALELAVAERREILQKLEATRGWEAVARTNFVQGLGEVDSAGRVGGVLEMEIAKQWQLNMQPYLDAADQAISRQREEFLQRRMECKQVETLVTNQRAISDVEVGRRAQQMLDDWYGRRGRVEATRAVSTSVCVGESGDSAELR